MRHTAALSYNPARAILQRNAPSPKRHSGKHLIEWLFCVGTPIAKDILEPDHTVRRRHIGTMRVQRVLSNFQAMYGKS
jgi:hypothetical protein